MSEYFEETNRLDSALRYLGIYDTIASEDNAIDMIADNKRRCMRVYTKLGGTENAPRYQEEYFAHTDSAMNPRRFLNVSNKFQQENQNRAGMMINDLRKTVANQKLVIIAIVFLAVVVALWLFFRHKEKVANVQLFRRNKELVEIEEKVRRIEHLRSVETHADVSAPSSSVESGGSGTDEDAARKDDGRQRQFFERIQSYMESSEDYCDPEFSLNRLAKEVESNTKYVSAAINEHTGKNFRTFINEFRIREARRRLLDAENYGNVTIQYLAESFRSSTQA